MTATITQDETIRTIEVYDPDAEELSVTSARAVARRELELSPDLWTPYDSERVNYNRVKVRFQLL